jgi:lysophospholipase L1-like esterase
MSSEVDSRVLADGAAAEPGPPARRRRRLLLVGLAVAVVALVVAGGALAVSQRSGGDSDLDVAIAGDSFIELTRDQFRAHADQLGMTNDVSAFGGTAACDWKEEVAAYAERHPRVLILSFAGNDVTPCMLRTPEPSSAEQTADEYESDFTAMVAGVEETSPDTRIYMVPPPPVRDAVFESNAAAMRSMYDRFAREHPEVTLIDVTTELGADHQFHASLPCEPWEQAECAADGTIVLRTDDGIHLTPAGGERYARVLLDAIGAQE